MKRRDFLASAAAPAILSRPASAAARKRPNFIFIYTDDQRWDAIRAMGRQPWLRAAVGIVGAFSFDTTSDSMRQFGNSGLFPQLSLIQPMFEDYVPDPGARDDPSADLTRANAEVFPMTFIAAAEYDVFRNASAVMAARLKEAGRLHSFKIYPRMAHLFFGFSREVECAANCVSDVAHFLAERMPAVSTEVFS